MYPMPAYPGVHNQAYSPDVNQTGAYNATAAPPPSYDTCVDKTPSAPFVGGYYSANVDSSGGFSSSGDGVGGGGGSGGGGGDGEEVVVVVVEIEVDVQFLFLKILW